MSAFGLGKPALRRHFAARRASRSPHQRRWAARQVSRILQPLLPRAGVLLAYEAMATELSLAPLLGLARQRGLQPVLPSLRDCPQVLGPALASAQPEPSLVLLPGLAFDAQGTRLGQGAGYYDRLLCGLPAGTLRIGVGFACQLGRALPRDPHDVPIDAFVCEKGLWLCRAVRPLAAQRLRAYCQGSPIEAIVVP